jgi:large subunit ribosomal protein L2
VSLFRADTGEQLRNRRIASIVSPIGHQPHSAQHIRIVRAIRSTYIMNTFKRVFKFTNAQRNARLLDRTTLWRQHAVHSLTASQSNTAGRNNTGMLVCHTRGTRAKHRLRIIDHLKIFLNVPGTIIRKEFDPARSAFPALLKYFNDVLSYSLLPSGSSVGDIVTAHEDVETRKARDTTVHFDIGDSSSLYGVPRGTVVHDVARYPGIGGSISRAAGSYSILYKRFTGIRKCLLKITSGALLSFSFYCRSTKGMVCNKIHNRVLLGEAGRNRLRGRKPVVRGVAMNPVDHPHGGGEGKKSKKCFPRTAWGKMQHWRSTGVRYVNVRVKAT